VITQDVVRAEPERIGPGYCTGTELQRDAIAAIELSSRDERAEAVLHPELAGGEVDDDALTRSCEEVG